MERSYFGSLCKKLKWTLLALRFTQWKRGVWACEGDEIFTSKVMLIFLSPVVFKSTEISGCFLFPHIAHPSLFLLSWHTSLSLSSMRLETWSGKKVECGKCGGGVVFPFHLVQLPDLIFCAATQVVVPAQSSDCCGVGSWFYQVTVCFHTWP